VAVAAAPHPHQIVILSEGGAFAADVEGPAVVFLVALAVAIAFVVVFAVAVAVASRCEVSIGCCPFDREL
jgi:hypothetical protein